jgi:hypothetical protein
MTGILRDRFIDPQLAITHVRRFTRRETRRTGISAVRCAGTVAVLLGLLSAAWHGVPTASFGQTEALAPIGGIVFDPPRPARIRRKSGNVLTGYLIAISPDKVHFRVESGKEFQYTLKQVTAVSLIGEEFLFNTLRDTYAQAVAQARTLQGVTIDGVVQASPRTAVPVVLRRPPEPPLAVVVSEPVHRALATVSVAGAAASSRPTPPAPFTSAASIQPQEDIWSNPWVKGGLMAGGILIILFWWRNKVG